MKRKIVLLLVGFFSLIPLSHAQTFKEYVRERAKKIESGQTFYCMREESEFRGDDELALRALQSAWDYRMTHCENSAKRYPGKDEFWRKSCWEQVRWIQANLNHPQYGNPNDPKWNNTLPALQIEAFKVLKEEEEAHLAKMRAQWGFYPDARP